jgi:hypothetical protein
MDVIEGGTERRPRRRRVFPVAWAVVLTAAAAYAAVRSTAGDGPGQVPPAVASASIGATAQPAPSPGSASGPPVVGACGEVAYRPVASLQPLTVRTGVRLLVGGYGLRFVDADTGTARPAAGVPANAQQTVTKLVSAGDRVYALSTACDGSAGRIYRVDGGAARPVAGPPAIDLISGAGRVWAVEQPDPTAHPAPPLVLRLVDSGRSLTLPAGVYPLVDSEAGLVVADSPPDPDNVPVGILVLDPTGAKRLRLLGSGHPLAAGRTDLLLLTGACAPGSAASCSITRVDIRTGRVLGRHPLPRRRVPVSPGSLSSDGKRVAFQLARPFADTRPGPGHPRAPSDVAVLRLDDGRLEIVPGLVMAPRSGAGLVFAGTDSWLFVSVSHGHHSHVYGWRPGVPGPLAVTRLPGPVAWAPPLVGG